MSEKPTNPCRRCGSDAGPGCPQPSSCGECPPVKCDACGGSDDRACQCWTSLEGMALADIKGLLAFGELSITQARCEGSASALDEYADHIMAEVARWDERVYPNRWINAREKANAARDRAAALRGEAP